MTVPPIINSSYTALPVFYLILMMLKSADLNGIGLFQWLLLPTIGNNCVAYFWSSAEIAN